jgi:hypothetical protein
VFKLVGAISKHKPPNVGHVECSSVEKGLYRKRC